METFYLSYRLKLAIIYSVEWGTSSIHILPFNIDILFYMDMYNVCKYILVLTPLLLESAFKLPAVGEVKELKTLCHLGVMYLATLRHVFP